MGNALSQLRLAVREFASVLASYKELSRKLQRSPGLPHANPTLPFWTVPASRLSKHLSSEQLPDYADIVIIGSGITGTSVARTLLLEGDPKLKVVMLEARETCSGATGRNGGHISPPLYLDYADLKETHGEAAAKDIIRFRLSHLTALAEVVESDDPERYSQHRWTETLDVFYDEEGWTEAKKRLSIYQHEMQAEGKVFEAFEAEDARDRFALAETAKGATATRGGAIHPYRLVTKILELLLDKYSNFSLYAETPCTGIQGPDSAAALYKLQTTRGNIETPHVVHATNAWTSTLLEGMRAKIIPIRGTMSAQRPGQGLPTPGGGRTHVFYWGTDLDRGYDYLTQLPVGEHEMMLGGAFGSDSWNEVGCTDDSTYDNRISSRLAGALPGYYGGHNWGAEAVNLAKPTDGEISPWYEGRVKALWSGILGISADGRPWVGRIPHKVSGRREPARSLLTKRGAGETHTAAPGEWISAGYSGEGMVHAWLSGKAVGYMVLGREDEADWLPGPLLVTEKRWKKAKIEDLLS